MRKSRILLIVGAIFVYYYFFWNTGYDSDKHIKERTAAFAEHCQFLEYPLKGHEGEKENADFVMKGMVVTFRHGERSALVPGMVAELPDCTAYHDVDRKSFEEYSEFTESNDFHKFFKFDKLFDGFPLKPQRSKCKLGEMTAEGALQLLRLAQLDVFVSSSYYHRTLQSGIAFLSGFLFDHSDKVPELFIKASNTTYFCLDNSCTCNNVQMTRDQFLSERSKLYLDRYADLHSDLKIVAKPIGIPHLSHPFEFVDAILGTYACRRLPLPCFENNECISLDTINIAAKTAEDLIREMYPKSQHIRRLYAAESYPIAHAVVKVIEELMQTTKDTSYIRVFSGHDITIIPLLLTMGLKNITIPPPYASRLVFEVYESKTRMPNEKFFVRVLYNGVDHTSDLKFCKSFHSGLCPAKDFANFVENSLLQDIGEINSMKEFCQIENSVT
uniref:Acid phosphatase n=1 Tax=Panagrolaimus sp. ES5 TaxID=591445 RepID=A0AC34F9E4_9BILA